MKNLKEYNGAFLIENKYRKTLQILLYFLIGALVIISYIAYKERPKDLDFYVSIGILACIVVTIFIIMYSDVVSLSDNGIDTYYEILGLKLIQRHRLDAGEYVLVAIERYETVYRIRGGLDKVRIDELYVKTKEDEYCIYKGESLKKIYEVKAEVEEALSHLPEFIPSDEISHFAHGYRGL